MRRFVVAFLIVVGLGASGLQASAQVLRQFPANALRGVIEFGEHPVVALNGEAARLAPGARIRGPNNMLVLPSALIGQRFAVNYTLDPNVHLRDVWILTAEEYAVKPWPTTPQETAQWEFDPAAQTWTKR